jgi:hypothetical protein
LGSRSSYGIEHSRSKITNYFWGGNNGQKFVGK